MTEKILALLSFVLLAGFIGIVVVFVNVPSLWAVMLLVLGFAFVDLWTSVRPSNGNGDRPT